MAKLHARLVLAALLVAIWLPVPAAPKSSPVMPSDLVGTWSGSWKNLKFKTTGSITAMITQPDANTLSIQYDVGGNVFGCSSASNTLILAKGTDFTDTSVNFTRTDAVLGAVMVTSLPKGNKLKGGGTGACGGTGVPSWTFKAKYKKTKLGTMLVTTKFKIKLTPKGTAKSIATITKQ